MSTKTGQKAMTVLVSPDRLPDYGYPRKYSNRHRQRLEKRGVLPQRVPINANRHAYIEEELIAHCKAYVEALIAKRDAKRSAPPTKRDRQVAAGAV
jgi:hypothetical protein